MRDSRQPGDARQSSEALRVMPKVLVRPVATEVLHNGFDLERPLDQEQVLPSSGSVMAFCDEKPNSISIEDSQGAR